MRNRATQSQRLIDPLECETFVGQIAASVEHRTTLLDSKSSDPHQIADGSKVVVCEIHARPREIHYRTQRRGDQQPGEVHQFTCIDHDFAHGDGDERRGSDPRGDIRAELMLPRRATEGAIDPGGGALFGDQSGRHREGQGPRSIPQPIDLVDGAEASVDRVELTVQLCRMKFRLRKIGVEQNGGETGHTFHGSGR